MTSICDGGLDCPLHAARAVLSRHPDAGPNHKARKAIGQHLDAYHHEYRPQNQETTVKKSKKTKAKKTDARQEQVRKAAVAAVTTYATERALRLAKLERLAKSGDVGYGYALAKAQLAAGREDDALASRGLPPLSQASQIQTAAAPAVARALGASVNGAPHDPRAALVSVFRDSYRRNSPQDLPGSTELPSLREIHELQKQLEKAQSSTGPAAMQRASQLSYMLTRLQLKRGHQRGEI
jgi:hypothetical protein